jgi:hypothetical protein
MADQQACYAAYFNVARHNLLLMLNDIAHRSGLSPIENEDQVANHPVLMQLQTWATAEAAGNNISDTNIRRVKQVVTGLQRALPILGDDFIQAISGQKISVGYKRPKPAPAQPKNKHQSAEKPIRTWRMEDLHWVLNMLLKTLMEQRNFYSHAHQNLVGLPATLASLLGTWFDAGRRTVKSRFEFLEREVLHLVRMNEVTKKEDPTALHALMRHENGAQRLTPRGTAFFCCLFLDKQQGNEFLKQVSGFKCVTGRPQQATLRTYLHWSIRLPFVRIDTESTAQSLALDMFNELARCPAEIYEHLSDADQQSFEIQPEVDDAWRTEADDGEGLVTRFIRHSDRFAPLMMECLDQLASANAQLDTGIRFQLDLGDFYFAVYPKRLPDGSTDVRRLKQKVLRFGVLPLAVQQAQRKLDAWMALERVNTARDYDLPYIVQSRPHYHLQDTGSIPIKLKGGCTNALYEAPQRDPAKPDRFAQLVSERPDFWLSPYELVNLAFYQHLRSKYALPEQKYPKVDDLLRKYQSSLRRLYEAMYTQPDAWRSLNVQALDAKLVDFSKNSFYTLRSQDLPADLLALLQGQAQAPLAVMHQQAQNTLHMLLADGDSRLADVQRVKRALNDRMKPGKPGHRVLRAGEMATYLAKDMLRLQPVQDESSPHKGKPTSIMADLLQARLAYFGRDKTSLPALFNSLRITGNNEVHKNHPFLHRIRVDAPGMNGIAQFYEAYLRERQTHLKALQTELASGPASLQSPALAWLHLAQTPKRLQGKDSVAALTQCYLQRMDDQEPLNLPRGLFRALTVEALLALDNPKLCQELQAELRKEAERGRFTSLSVLVALYFSHVQKDASQDFYFYELPRLQAQSDALEAADWRTSPWAESFEKHLKGEDRHIQGRVLADALAAEREVRRKRLKNKIHDLDRMLNQRATQDQVLFLAAQQLIDLNQVKEKAKAHAGDALQAPLFEKIKLQTLQREDLNAMVPHAVCIDGKTIYVDGVKAKNIGQFKSLARDRRLPGMLHYYPAERIHASMVAHELQTYPRAQNQAFEDILAFENAANVRQKWQADDPAVEGKGKRGLHHTLMEQHLTRSALPAAQRQTLQAEALTLRNAFCHNQTPAPDNVRDDAAQPMLAASQAHLAPARQTAQGIGHIKDNTVAQHFAKALRERYTQLQALQPTPNTRKPQ